MSTLRKIEVEFRGPVGEKEVYIELKASKSKNVKPEPLIKSVDKSVESGKSVAIIGEFGTGKTTFVRYYEYKKRCEWLENPYKSKSVVFLNLNEYSKKKNTMTMFRWIVNNIKHEIGFGIKRKEFEKYLNEEKLLLIFDGLDEVANLPGKDAINRSIRKINNISRKGSPVIITSRKAFLESEVDEGNLKDFTKLYIEDLDISQIRGFVKKKIPGDWENFIESVFGKKEIADLDHVFENNKEVDSSFLELVRRPLFLDMMTHAYQSGHLKRINNPAALYEVLTNDSMIEVIEENNKKESNKKETRLIEEDMKQIIQELAFRMFLDNQFSYNDEELREIIYKISDKISNTLKQKYAPERVLKDISNVSFLVRDKVVKAEEKGFVAFKHRSFIEYFTAHKLASELKERNTDNFSIRILYEEIFEFLAWIMTAKSGKCEILALLFLFDISFYLWYIKIMDYALKERIGKPELFTGRKQELAYFLKWINDIRDEKSQSTAILARRKMGKTAIMERLFNITFYKNDGVIPFYYEIKENDVWVLDFCQDFFLTFVYQYIAFKTRKPGYLKPETRSDFGKTVEIAKKEGLDYLCGIIEDAAHAVFHQKIDILWNIVREAPQTIAFRQQEFIVQMIDEFQFMNAMIYWDKDKKNLAKNLAGGYLSTAESKIAPLLVSGSWVGWLMDELNKMLPSRFRYKYLKNMPENEASEVLFKYSRFFDVPVTEDTAFSLVRITEGNPFYISSVIRSDYPDKDLTSIDGLTGTLEFETLDDQGLIKSSWMEYMAKAFPKINDRNAKNIVLHLSKHRDRDWTREELREALSLEMTESDLELKLNALVKSDIINKGRSYYCYRGVNDNIFDKVFRGVYDEEIRKFGGKAIRKEYSDELKKEKERYKRLLGKLNYQKGYHAEFLILNQLLFHAARNNELLKSVTRYLPDDFNFCDYSRVWKYHSSPEYAKVFSVDIFARSVNSDDYSIIGEVKNRENKKFSIDEINDFELKFAEIKRRENLERGAVVGFIFSRNGFTAEAEEYCREKGIACSEDERWLESGDLKTPVV